MCIAGPLINRRMRICPHSFFRPIENEATLFAMIFHLSQFPRLQLSDGHNFEWLIFEYAMMMNFSQLMPNKLLTLNFDMLVKYKPKAK